MTGLLWLDPEDKQTQGIFQPRSPIPPAVRAFGRYPNSDQWLPGDILLFSALVPGLLGQAIRSNQKWVGYGPQDACWQHAAIYVGQDRVCEAVWPRIRLHTILDRITTHRIRVRRMPNLTADQRYNIAISALAKLHSGYGWSELPRLAVSAVWRRRAGVRQRPIARICSQLCASAYASTVPVVLSVDAGYERATTPADLALSQQLQDVPAFWRALTD